MGLHSNSRTSNSDWLYSGNNWLNMGSISISMGLGSIQGAGLAGNRPLNWVALFNWNLDGDWVWDLGTGGDRLGVALGLRNSSGDSVAGGDWLGHTDSLWNSSRDGGTGLS